jgi:hypothetical protein
MAVRRFADKLEALFQKNKIIADRSAVRGHEAQVLSAGVAIGMAALPPKANIGCNLSQVR